MREQLMLINGALQWQWWNHHDGMWNNYVLYTSSGGHNSYVISCPTQWQSSCVSTI